jgi:hypothetical protein
MVKGGKMANILDDEEIDFSEYEEKDLFKLDLHPIDRFLRGDPFSEKHALYVANLEKKGVSNETLNILKLIGVEPDPDAEYPIDPKCIFFLTKKVNIAYTFYTDLLKYKNRVKSLETYDCEFQEVFEIAWRLVQQVFYKIGTRYQLYGYFDDTVNKLIEDDIDAEEFKEKMCTGNHDMSELIDPLVEYIRLIELGEKIVETCWTSSENDPNYKNIMSEYSKGYTTVSQDSPRDIEWTLGSTMQVTSKLDELILNPTGNNIEMLKSKAVKIIFNQYNMQGKLRNLKSEFKIPNYN